MEIIQHVWDKEDWLTRVSITYSEWADGGAFKICAMPYSDPEAPSQNFLAGAYVYPEVQLLIRDGEICARVIRPGDSNITAQTILLYKFPEKNKNDSE